MLNRGYSYRSILSQKDVGSTLLLHLTERYRHSSSVVWQQRIDRGEISVDGVTSDALAALRPGQTLVWHRPPWEEPDTPQRFEILFDDPTLLAVNKPSGLPTIPGGGFFENTLLRLVQKQSPDANPVHRLGRATSGIVLFAKSTEAAAQLSASWNSARVRKIYRALSQGVAQRNTYDIVTPIGPVPHPLLGSVWAATARGKPSRSIATVISRTACFTTFKVALHSGRPHQIRIHLASIGHPLVGDPLYGAGGQPVELPGLPGNGGYSLHAQFLRFEHPITGVLIHLEAPLPAGFAEA